MTRFIGTRWVDGPEELTSLVSTGLDKSMKWPSVIGEVAGRFPLDHASDAYRALEAAPKGKSLVAPG